MYQQSNRRRRRHITIKEQVDKPPPPPLGPLHMYETIPTLTVVDLKEFENVAVERCLLHKIIENANRSGLKVNSEQWRCFIIESVKTENLTTYFGFFNLTNGKAEPEAKCCDHLSHYILRLAYCKRIELMRRFCELEVQLFLLKFFYLSAKEKTDLYKIYLTEYEPMNCVEKWLMLDELSDCCEDVSLSTEFYVVPFWEALNLVRERKVYLKNGKAYLPESQLYECLLYLFRNKMKVSMREILDCLFYVDSDERIKNILNELEMLAIQKRSSNTYNVSVDVKVCLNDLETYWKEHYPLCMYSLHKTLTTEHHLKHFGRIQYGRFLKQLGCNCNEIISIFRHYFSKKSTGKEFKRKYIYSIEYMFGLKGRKVAQNGYNCQDILRKPIGCMDQHGCPYKNWSRAKLQEVLQEKCLSPSGNFFGREIKQILIIALFL